MLSGIWCKRNVDKVIDLVSEPFWLYLGKPHASILVSRPDIIQAIYLFRQEDCESFINIGSSI